MSSVANNHGAFAQQSLMSPQKSPSTGAQHLSHSHHPHPSHHQTPPSTPVSGGGGVPMSFYNKRDDCYSLEPVIRTRQSTEYSQWAGMSTVASSGWTDVPQEPTNPPPPPPPPVSNPECLPPAHNILSAHGKDNSRVAGVTTSTVMTNQNGKTFVAPATTSNSAGYPRYDQGGGYPQQQQQQQQYPPKRSSSTSSYTNQRLPYLDNSMGVGGMNAMDYVEGQASGFQPPPQPHLADPHFSTYRYSSSDATTADKVVNGLTRPKGIGAGVRTPYSSVLQHAPTDSTGGGSPQGSIGSSDGETTASSRGGGAGSIHLSGSNGTVGQQQKRPRKPAPTLATGRRNLKSEPVDPDEADRRMKRRERNRKSAQKCRERKLHRTQELQGQVETLNMEASRLLREVEGWREHARRCAELLRQHCPGVAVPYMNCLLDSNPAAEGGYLATPASVSASTPTTVTPHVISHLEPEPMAFCDDVGGFYNAKSEVSYPGMVSGSVSVTTASGSAVGGASSVWDGRAFSPVTSQLPPMSQLVPTPPSTSASKGPVVVKTEPSSAGAYWKNEEAIDSFLSEVHQDDREVEWKTENDTDSSPGCGVPQLHTPNTNDGDKASNLSSSL